MNIILMLFRISDIIMSKKKLIIVKTMIFRGNGKKRKQNKQQTKTLPHIMISDRRFSQPLRTDFTLL